MPKISLLRAQPDAVAPPTERSESFQLLLAVKKTKRKDSYTKANTSTPNGHSTECVEAAVF